MKYLLSILLFLGFIFFSIPCFAVDNVTNNDASFNLQNQTVNVVNKALLPGEVIQDASDQASLVVKTEVGVASNLLTSITNLACSISNIISDLTGLKIIYCPAGLSVGENTAQYAAGSKILGQSSMPKDMELLPARKDDNLGYQGQEDQGNDKLNQLSENLGTTTGFFKNDQPPLSDYDDCVQKRMKDKNFNLNEKSFEKDQRSADIYCSKQVFCMGNYPEVDGKAICPFEPPNTPTSSP